MKMWMIDPKYLCRKHLLGEHSEIHKFKPTFEKKYSIKGRISPVVQIEPMSMEKRHDELAQEMKRRGYKHESPYEMPDLSYLLEKERNAKVDVKRSIEDLLLRCPECEIRFQTL